MAAGGAARDRVARPRLGEGSMRNPGEIGGLPPALQEQVLERLGFSDPPSLDQEGLGALYGAWCARVPFDNVRKMIVLRTRPDDPLPGADADEFFEHWLAHGTGGTCWPTSNALFELVHALGFEARRVAGSMHDLGVVNHASVKVRIDGGEWLVDSSQLTNVPLPLGDRVFVHDDAVFPAEVEPVDGTFVLWTHSPPNSTHLPCRLLVDPATRAAYVAGYDASRTRSPFNQRLYVRRNRPGELLVLAGKTRFSRTARGLGVRELEPDEICDALREDAGLSDALIDQWVRCGGLEASFEPPSGPKPPPVTRKPPSLREPQPPR